MVAVKPGGKPRRLKVFLARIGFYDTVVAAPSRPAALQAWGVHRNLFADDEAQETTEPQAVAAALAAPGTPLRRAIGSDDPFSLTPEPPDMPRSTGGARRPRSAKAATPPEPAPPESMPSEPVQRKLTPATTAPAKRPLPKPLAPKPLPPDRTALERAQKALDTLLAERQAEEKTIADRRAALDAAESQARHLFDDARSGAEKLLAREQAAYAKAGGSQRRGG